MSSAEKLYGLLLRAYPREFRADYGREMLLTFRQLRRDDTREPARFWGDIVWDILRSAPSLGAEALSKHWRADLHLGGRKMKAMAILAVLIGALEVFNTLGETVAGGLSGRPGMVIVALVLAALCAALLLVAGIALLIRGRSAGALARSAAVACLVVFAGIAALKPMFSVAASILGIVFPAVLLAFLFRDAARGRPATR